MTYKEECAWHYGKDESEQDETCQFCYTEEHDCPTCGSNIGPSDSFPWHYWEEDCRAVRIPTANNGREA